MMKKTKLALAITLSGMTALTAMPAMATNGDVLIGLGAQSRALGGTGTAAFFGSENALTNPALLAKIKGSEFSIGGTVFMPDVKADATTFGAASRKSDGDMYVIPEVSMATVMDNGMVFGLGMFGSAGMGVDYRNDVANLDTLLNAYSNLQLMKFAPAIAGSKDNWGWGFAPVLQYGALDINYTGNDGANNPVNVGSGMSTDYGFGFNLGAYMDVNSNLTLGFAYQSAISMTYDNQLSVASAPFVNPGQGLLSAAFSDKLEQPAEIKVGAAYTNGHMTYTGDVKQIQYGSAKGYKDFNWDDQTVIALGAKYTGQKHWWGVGLNYAEDPISVLADTSPANQVINMFNNLFFPGIVETHITVGGGYMVNKNMTLEGALVYATEVDKTVNTGFISQQPNPAATSLKTTHSQSGVTFGLRMNF
jgi:long-chain fatty acid transport protein